MVARQFPVIHLELLLEVCGFESRLGRFFWPPFFLPALFIHT